MATTKVPIQKPSDPDLLSGINKALQILMQEPELDQALRQSLITISSLANSINTVFLQVEKDKEEDGLSLKGVLRLHWEEEEYVSLPFEKSQYYPTKHINRHKWLSSLLAGDRVFGKGETRVEGWQDLFESLSDEITAYLLFPVMLNGQLRHIIGISSTQAGYIWSDMQIMAIETFSTTLINLLARREAEAESIQQRDFLRNIIDSIPSLICTKNKQGRLTLVNQAMADFHGIRPEELVGKTNAALGFDQKVTSELLAEDQMVLKKGKTVKVADKRMLDHNQHLRILSVIKTPLRDKMGEVTEALCLGFDMTEQKLIEERLNESHRFRKHLTSLLPDCILLLDVTTQTVVFSNHTHFMGYQISSEPTTAPPLLDFLRPDDSKKDWQQYIEQLEKKSDKHIHTREYRVQHQETKQYCWISEFSRVFKRDSQGRVLQYLVVLHDVTPAKIAFREEAKTKERYQNFIRYGIEGIYYVSCEPGVPTDLPVEKQVDLYYKYAVVEECNESMARMYKLDGPNDLIGMRIYDMHKGEAWEQNQESLVELVRGGYRVDDAETIEIDAKGIEHHFINRGVGVIEDGKLIGIWGVQQEISEKRRAEKALLESELRLNNIVEAANIGLWEWDISTNLMSYNDQCAKILGFEAASENVSIHIEDFFKLIHREDLSRLKAAFAEHRETNNEHYEVEFRMRSVDDWKWMFTRGRIVSRDQSNAPLLVRGTQIDIDTRKRSELLMRENEALMNSLFNNSSLGIKFIDEHEVIFKTNQRYCDLMLTTPKEVIGRNAFQYNLPEHRDAMRSMLQEAIVSGKEELIFEKQFVRSDHRVVWAKVSLNIFRKEDQSLKYIIALLEDITGKRKDRQELRESKELLAAALQTLPDLKFRMDLHGRILEIYATDHDLSFFGMPSSEVIGKNLDSLLPLFAAQGLLHNVKTSLQEKEVQKVALLVPNEEGVEHYEARMNAINEDEVMVVVRNVTENMLTEQKLYETIHNMELSNRKLQSYIDSNLQLENFAYIASHDLREPVRTMRTFAQIIDKRYREKLDQDGRTYLDFVINSADQMNQLIMDLLAYSRINSEETENVDINIGELLRDIVSNLSQSIIENHVEIETDNLPLNIQGSPTKLKQLFQNLLINAIKFRHPDRDPLIRITSKELRTHWQFSVIDNGIGIKPEFFEIIFALFKRLHNRRDYQGTGLGLAICKKIVEQHSGEIWVASEPEKGATFSFTIQK